LSVSESAGCSGYTYQIDYVEKQESEDLVFKFEDISVFIDTNSFKYLKGTKVDFLVEGVNEGIKFLNPNVKAICGCGESFEVDI
jgi:iron-sulfur cluster assembly protein